MNLIRVFMIRTLFVYDTLWCITQKRCLSICEEKRIMMMMMIER